MKKINLILIIISLISNAYAQEKSSVTKSCRISAYVLDKDPNGLNVRETSSKDGKILRRLKKGEGEISLDITGTSGTGWVRIANVWDGSSEEESKVTGWVFATMLGTGTKGYPNYNSSVKLYAAANKKAKVVRMLPSEAEVVIQECSGSWVKVSYEGSIGWLAPENQCGSPFTTCS